MDFNLNKEIKLSDSIFDARFHPSSENDLIAAVTISGNVHLIESGELKTKLKKHHKGSSIRKVRFFGDGRMVTIAKTAKVYDLTANQTSCTLKRDDGKPTTFYSVRPFGANIISAGDDDGGIFVWDLRTPDAPIFSSYDCEQYISDIDGKFETRRLMVCTSGEGTLTAYDLRANKMIEPQSELFEAGFQCLKLVEANKKVVIGGEDGAIYVFNQNEWAHTSGKLAVSSDLHNRGKCSIDCIDTLAHDESTILVGCSDGKLRNVSLWPHEVLSEKVFCRKSPLESIHVKGDKIVLAGGNYLNLIDCCETNTQNDEESTRTSSDVGEEESEERRDACKSERNEDENNKQNKKSKTDDGGDDYLNIFN